MLRTYLVVLVVAVITASFVARSPRGVQRAEPTMVIHAAQAPSAAEAGAPQKIDALDSSIELSRDSSGYFYADVQINGAPVHMLVDTGATMIALSRNDAQMAGLAPSIAMNSVVGQGADGVVKGEPVTLERVTLGGKTVENLPAVVLNSGGQSLLGQSFLSQFSSVHIEGDKMVLR
jgi:aspartyl protease family protein